MTAAINCYPTPTTSINYYENYYYSPAYCPSGYLLACPYTAGSPLLSSTITASLCCPSYIQEELEKIRILTHGIEDTVVCADGHTDAIDQQAVPSLTSLFPQQEW